MEMRPQVVASLKSPNSIEVMLQRTMEKTPRRAAAGFTLIELLIVVAIISILAAIAIPNYLEAQVRAKVAKCHSEMRSLAIGLETYRMENPAYPFAYYGGWLLFNDRLIPLTTPIAYLASLPVDIFQLKEEDRMYDYNDRLHTEALRPMYWTREAPYFALAPQGAQWQLASVGPDKQEDCMIVLLYTGAPIRAYDTSNGTVSRGDIYRWGP